MIIKKLTPSVVTLSLTGCATTFQQGDEFNRDFEAKFAPQK